jgi:hypothetical protein
MFETPHSVDHGNRLMIDNIVRYKKNIYIYIKLYKEKIRKLI